MSDDLISRKAAYKAFSDYLNRNFIGEISSQTELSIGEIASVIKSIPVAFDKEKVMAKLRSEYMDASNMYSRLRGTAHSYSSEARKDAWEKAVEIVEKGGIK